MKHRSTVCLLRAAAPLAIFAALAWPAIVRAQAPSVPLAYQAINSLMYSDLDTFDASLGTPAPYPYVPSAAVPNANANAGPVLLSPGYIEGIQIQLQELKAMGVGAVLVEIGFPMLYEPFFSSQAEYQQYVNFYTQFAANVRALGLKLIVENDILWSSVNTTGAGWNPTPLYASLDWDQYQQARAQTAAVIAQTMHPDYMTVLSGPDVEASTTGQTAVNTPAGCISMLTEILSTVRQSAAGVKLGAGVGNSMDGFLPMSQAMVSTPLDFLDVHVYVVNGVYAQNALTIAGVAAGAGLPLTMTETWLHKVLDSEIGVLTQNQIEARNPYSFWAPLDSYFIQSMESFANYSHMIFLDFFETHYLWAYLPYDDTTENLNPALMQALEVEAASQATAQAQFTSSGMSYYNSNVTPPDKTLPSAPSSMSADPNTSTVSWPAATDNVGVAGYYLYRDGVRVAATSSTSYQDSGLAQGITYTYTLQAFDLAGNMSWPWESPSVKLTTPNVPPPAPPTNLAGAAVSSQKVKLTWMPPSGQGGGIHHYIVLWGAAPDQLTKVGSPSKPYFFSFPLSPATTYYYAVESVDTQGQESAMSAIVSVSTLALPTPPGSVTAAPNTDTQIILNWIASTGTLPIHFYYIYRGTSSSGLVQIDNIKPATTYTDTQLTSGTTYYYAVAAVDNVGDVSPLSNIPSATTYTPPSTPGSFAASTTSATAIALSWAASTPGSLPIAKYSVLRGTTSGSLTPLGNSTATSYNDTGLTPGTTYYYEVKAVDTAKDGSLLSNQALATTYLLPTTPTLTATVADATKVSLSWTASTGSVPIVNYEVFRGSSASNLKPWATRTTTTYNDTGLTPGATYYYAVQATDNAGDLSLMSAVVSATTDSKPTTPAVTATPESTSKVGLTWIASTATLPIKSYEVYRGTTEKHLTKLASTSNTSYTDDTVTSGDTYYYAVEATDTKGDTSARSAVVSATAPTAPTAPTNLAASATASTKVALTWSPSAGGGLSVASYNILRGASASSLTVVASSPVASYTDTSVSGGATYYYAVEGVDTGGDLSAMSNVVSAATPALPSKPTGVKLTAVSRTEISLKWDASTGGLPVVNYLIFRGLSRTTLTQVATSTTTTYKDTSLSPKTNYFYAVQAVDSAGDLSPQSAVVSERTKDE